MPYQSFVTDRHYRVVLAGPTAPRSWVVNWITSTLLSAWVVLRHANFRVHVWTARTDEPITMRDARKWMHMLRWSRR